MSSVKRFFSLAGLLAFFVISIGTPLNVFAGHSWGGYHWFWDSGKFTGAQLPLTVNDNTTPSSAWRNGGILDDVISIWNQGCPSINPACLPSISTPLVLGKQYGKNTSNERKCPPTLGQIDVCNTTYGRNGWLGIASVWVSGKHITQGTVKLNDTYFNTSTYNKPAWRNLVLCQELGHTLGLDHQDTIFTNANLNTCMDYTNLPDSNQWANYHDFEELKIIYNHIDATSGTSSTASSPGKAPPEMANDMNERSQWGKQLRAGGTQVYLLDIGDGHKIYTFVLRAE